MNGNRGRTVKMCSPSRSVENISVMLLFLAFSCCALMLVLTGARVYKTINETSAENHELRGSVAYIINRLRAADNDGSSIELSNDSKNAVISICEQIGDSEYSTHIYVYNGTLYELFIDSDFTYDQGDGESIAAINSLGCEYNGGMITVWAVTPEGSKFTASVSLHAAAVREEKAK